MGKPTWLGGEIKYRIVHANGCVEFVDELGKVVQYAKENFPDDKNILIEKIIFEAPKKNLDPLKNEYVLDERIDEIYTEVV